MNTIHATQIATELPSILGQTVYRALAAMVQRSRSTERLHGPSIALAKGETHWVDRPMGLDVSCQEGELWLALDYQPQDVVLCAGQSYRCTTDSRLSVHAMQPSQFRFQ